MIEEAGSAGGKMVSHGLNPYLHDFAAVVSLGLNATCSRRADIASRLIGQSRSASVVLPVRSLVPRVFDDHIFATDDEIDRFVQFVEDLIALNRESFLRAMRAIRTYVSGMHRLHDDLDVAYTLFVASIESLSAGFEAFEPRWSDYQHDKRRKIEAALVSADPDTARKVKDAVLENDKASSGRRFREFALAQVQRSYFREDAQGVNEPASRYDLEEALRKAYGLRSRYIHGLRELPKLLAINADSGDTIRMAGETLLTFQGITRLARHLITEFVAREPKVEKEEYNYLLEQHGVVQLELGPEYWVGRTESPKMSDGTKRLSGFLSQLSSCFAGVANASVTDLKPLLLEVERKFPGSTAESRRAFLALYLIFNELEPDEDKRLPNYRKMSQRYEGDLIEPSIEGMLVHMMRKDLPDWPLAEYQKIFQEYFQQRGRRNGVRLPRTLEAGMSLELAEQHRMAGQLEEARTFLARATESQPGHRPLWDLEDTFDGSCKIDWFEVIFGAGKEPDP